MLAHLWRHVVQSAHTGVGGLTIEVQRKAKVAQAQLARCCEEQILWLDVPVQDPLHVQKASFSEASLPFLHPYCAYSRVHE